MALKSNEVEELIANPQIFQRKWFISHIRYASAGKQVVGNTHPFKREIFDKSWVFAHNGHLDKRKILEDIQKEHYLL